MVQLLNIKKYVIKRRGDSSGVVGKIIIFGA